MTRRTRRLSPPPKVNDPKFNDWTFQLWKSQGVPTDSSIIAAQIFGRKDIPGAPDVAERQSILAVQSFGPKQPPGVALGLDVAEKQSVLANQIFGD